MKEIKIGDIVQHKKDKYIGKVKSIDNIFIHLDNGKHILKQYAILIEGESINDKNS